ncbi:polycystin-2-like [Silurus asotus]|uniref:Polycystin-2-like n=1 Tax=Silurus asotus TaxID=30991 RepID=A0AAD4ZZC0_SILAS|nr:polycystin-2-like [Silurus asotus]
MKRLSRVSSSGHDNPGLELRNAMSSQSMQQHTGTSTSVRSTSVVRSVSQWASYARGRWKRATRKCTKRKALGESLSNKYKGLAWEEDVLDGAAKEHQLNKRLLDHFRVLAANNEDTDEVDLQYLNEILRDGADPNSVDKYGQTALHEISRAWNVDVMRFFFERGADIRRPDAFGVTPLHVAAALDYKDMICFLLERGADVEAQTYRDMQTPLHFAAKNDATEAIQILLQSGANIAAHDYKQRTPLQLAATLDRSEAAQTLLELGADPGVQDSDGQLCITAMIDKMTPVLAFIVHQGKLDLIMHPVMLKLITVKWNLYGRLGAWILLLLNFLFIVSWTTVAISVSVSSDEKKRYVFPQDWWRVFVVMIALGLTMLEVYREVMEILRSVKKLKDWQQWCEQRLNEDLACTHPMWPEEQHYFEAQIKFIRSIKGSYMQDPWNIFDWLVYTLLIAVLGLHMADVYLVSQTLRMYSLRMFAVAVIVLWLRLMKHVRGFRVMGPFIVMLGKIVGDVLRFLFLYAEIYVPYACAFWIIFGGLTAVPSMKTVPQMLYSLYRITLVDDYEFDAMVAVDPIMAHLLCGTFLALSAVLCVNLMIALLSDTFQRVYDNALANAVMQQASIILQVEESMPQLWHFYDKQYIHSCCAPLGEFYDDDLLTDPDQHERMKKLAAEIKVQASVTLH